MQNPQNTTQDLHKHGSPRRRQVTGRSQWVPLFLVFVLLILTSTQSILRGQETETKPPQSIRVFIFAGQSNMVGSDSKVDDIDRFPPFRGLEKPQKEVLFHYSIGRENKTESTGWEELKPINNIVGPELSFARELSQSIKDPIAIIKVAAGGTHLGGDWNPDEPIGFKMYPRALTRVKQALADLQSRGFTVSLEAFVWHQGENDMFNETYRAEYGKNLKRYLQCWRRDLNSPKLHFLIGELCTKTIWGMDLRPRMYDISLGQKSVTSQDPNATYIPTSHVGVEIGGGVGLHYHYGTLGQLQHGVNYAKAWLHKNSDSTPPASDELKPWPYPAKSKVKLFVMAGHRNMEGERAFVQDLTALKRKDLLDPLKQVAFQYRIGDGVHDSRTWESLRPAGLYDTFGPEISFGRRLVEKGQKNFAIAKFTHSGSQIIDWTPAGSEAKSRNLSDKFLTFVKQSVADLEKRGHQVELAGIFYHVGENDMSMYPYRQKAPQWLKSIIENSRRQLDRPNLKWFLSQQPPTDDKRVNEVKVTEEIAAQFASDPNTIHLKMFNLPPQEKKLVIDTRGIIALGEELADAYLNAAKK